MLCFCDGPLDTNVLDINESQNLKKKHENFDSILGYSVSIGCKKNIEISDSKSNVLDFNSRHALDNETTRMAAVISKF